MNILHAMCIIKQDVMKMGKYFKSCFKTHNKNAIVCGLWLTSDDKTLSMLKEGIIPSHLYKMYMLCRVGCIVQLIKLNTCS